MIRNYLKIALRALRRRTSYALINGVGFSVGLICCVLVLLFIRHELRYDRFHEDANEVHRVLRDKRGNWWSTIPFPQTANATAEQQRRLPRALETQIPAIESATNFYVGPHGQESSAFVEIDARRFTENNLLYTTTGSSFFDVFSFEFIQGQRDEALSSPGTAVLTTTAAERYFGTIDVVGNVFTVRSGNDTLDVEVTGVIEDVPSHSHFDFDVALHVDRIDNWGAYTYFRMRPGTDTTGMAARLKSVMNQVRPERVQDPLLRSVLGGVRTQALTDIHLGPRLLYDQKSHRDPRHLWAFGAIGILVLVIVVINYTNLAVALSTEREHEIGVRKAMGSGRSLVATQFFLEAIVLTLASIPVALAALHRLIPAFNAVMDTGLPTNLLASPGLLAGLVGLAIGVGAIAGSYPALVLSQKDAVSLFRGSSSDDTPQRWSMRHALIGVQFALLIGLGCLTWFVNSQLHYLQTKDLGFQTQGIVELSTVDSVDTYRQMKTRLAGATEVEALGAGIAPGPGRFHVTYREQDGEQIRNDGDFLNVDPGWFEVLDISHPVVEEMQQNPGQSPPRLIVNQAAVRALGYEEPIGKTVVVAPQSSSPDRIRIDGVVDNFHFRPLYERVQPTFLRVRPRPQNVRAVLARVDVQNLNAGLDRLENVWASVRPDTPFAPQFVDDQLAQLYEEEQRVGQMGMGLTIVALLLAALGLVGLSAYVVRRRTKEIGVRKALGATIADIVLRLNREFLILVALALVAATPVAYWLAHQWLSSFAYRIDMNPLVFVGAGGAAIFVALAAAGYQAWSTARVSPAEALRQE